MKVGDIPSENGWVITRIGKDAGKIFLMENGRQTKNSMKAVWFSYQSYAEDFLKDYGTNLWQAVTW